jgi:hypothetical protein
MKKMLSLLAAISLGVSSVFADAPAEKRSEMLDYIAKLKAQEYVHELVQLKTKLSPPPPDAKPEDILAIRDQIAAINQELVALVTLPIQIRKKESERKVEELKGTMHEGNPVILQLKAEIAACDLQIERAKAELEGLKDRK